MKKIWRLAPELFEKIEQHYGGFSMLYELDGSHATDRGQLGRYWFHPANDREIGDGVIWAFELALSQHHFMACLLPAAVNRQWFYTAWENARSILFLRGDVAPFPACVAVFAHPDIEVPPWGPDCEIGFEVRR